MKPRVYIYKSLFEVHGRYLDVYVGFCLIYVRWADCEASVPSVHDWIGLVVYCIFWVVVGI